MDGNGGRDRDERGEKDGETVENKSNKQTNTINNKNIVCIG